MPASTTYDLPISGMTCASCAGRVERALRKVDGAEQVSVNLATEQARVQAPGDSLPALMEAVERAGYSVPQQTIELNIEGMTCAACVTRVEKVLSRVPGVAGAEVNLATNRARVTTSADVSLAALTEAVSRAGYSAVPVAEAMMACVLLDHLLLDRGQTGGIRGQIG